MIGLDTNVLVRYLTQDDPVQSPKANALIEGLSRRQLGFVSIVAMTETAWVLERAYGFSRSDIAAVIERLLQAENLHIDHDQAVFSAMIALKAGSAEFAEALIGALGFEAGCSHTVTFDQKASRLPTFQIL